MLSPLFLPHLCVYSPSSLWVPLVPTLIQPTKWVTGFTRALPYISTWLNREMVFVWHMWQTIQTITQSVLSMEGQTLLACFSEVGLINVSLMALIGH